METKSKRYGKKKIVNNLGKRIKTARELAGFTQESLAEAVGVSRTAVAKWERGDIEPNLFHIKTLSELMNVSADYLLNIKSEKRNLISDLSDEALWTLEKFIGEVKNK